MTRNNDEGHCPFQLLTRKPGFNREPAAAQMLFKSISLRGPPGDETSTVQPYSTSWAMKWLLFPCVTEQQRHWEDRCWRTRMDKGVEGRGFIKNNWITSKLNKIEEQMWRELKLLLGLYPLNFPVLPFSLNVTLLIHIIKTTLIKKQNTPGILLLAIICITCVLLGGGERGGTCDFNHQRGD